MAKKFAKTENVLFPAINFSNAFLKNRFLSIDHHRCFQYSRIDPEKDKKLTQGFLRLNLKLGGMIKRFKKKKKKKNQGKNCQKFLFLLL